MFWFCDQFNAKEVRIWESNIKGELDKYNIIPLTFSKKIEIFIPLEPLALVMTAFDSLLFN